MTVLTEFKIFCYMRAYWSVSYCTNVQNLFLHMPMNDHTGFTVQNLFLNVSRLTRITLHKVCFTRVQIQTCRSVRHLFLHVSRLKRVIFYKLCFRTCPYWHFSYGAKFVFTCPYQKFSYCTNFVPTQVHIDTVTLKNLLLHVWKWTRVSRYTNDFYTWWYWHVSYWIKFYSDKCSYWHVWHWIKCFSAPVHTDTCSTVESLMVHVHILTDVVLYLICVYPCRYSQVSHYRNFLDTCRWSHRWHISKRFSTHVHIDPCCAVQYLIVQLSPWHCAQSETFFAVHRCQISFLVPGCLVQ